MILLGVVVTVLVLLGLRCLIRLMRLVCRRLRLVHTLSPACALVTLRPCTANRLTWLAGLKVVLLACLTESPLGRHENFGLLAPTTAQLLLCCRWTAILLAIVDVI